ncbi:hypothetical protein ACHAXH_001867, partial [Discostella pseudostelligera]
MTMRRPSHCIRQQAIAFFLCVHDFLAVCAWPATVRIGASRSTSVTLFGSGLLANTIRCCHRRSSATATVCFAKADNEGECGATTTINLVDAPKSSSDTVHDATINSSSSSLSRKPNSGDVVTFTLHRFQPIRRNSQNTNDNNDSPQTEPLFDTTGTLQLVLNGGNYIPGLHHLLSTMYPGELLQGATIDAGYGDYNPQLVFPLPISSIGNSIDQSLVKIGTVLQMGNGMECRIIEMNDDSWILDANQVLAGTVYEMDVRLEKVEKGPTNWDYVPEGNEDKYKVATFALGCFWGGELAYQRMPGVISTHVGYTQGHKESPTYEEVCTGTTGHTEAIRIVYDPNVVSYKSLVQLGLDRLGDNVYLLNQVGNDRGTQYRHGIYYHNDDQQRVADELLN